MAGLGRPCAALAIAIGAALAGGGASAGPLDEPHLPIVPRTPAEAARIADVTRPADEFTRPERFEELPAGAATVRVRASADAFSSPSNTIGFEGELKFKVGNGLFRKLWVSSPSSTQASDGLGPLYNARACQSCHIKDGRGHPPEGLQDSAASMIVRISVPDEAAQIREIAEYLGTAPDPTYGAQLQDLALPGIPAEYRLQIDYSEIPVALSDGEMASLRAPTYTAADLGYGPLHPEAMLSPRIAPQMIGLGLLEAVPAADIMALADPDDTDGDGISGRANIVWSAEHAMPMLGRFGLKAGSPTLREQSAAAFAGDIGISTPVYADPFGDCTADQPACRNAPHGDGDVRVHEADETALDLITFYSRNLGVPARRDVGAPEVLRGKEIFHQIGCASCHTPKFVTHRLDDQPEQSFQLIWPHTDLLLHDMGEGLADHRPEARATGSEWRTAPLWGIGLTEQVSGHSYFLHDGRARSLLEAVLWHGGEAQAARDAVTRITSEDRAALLSYLKSL